VSFNALRILVVEDESLVAMLLEQMLEELGFGAIRIASSLSEAHEALEQERPDLAALDVNVRGEQVFPIAAALAARGAPFVFVTGYGEQGLSAEWQGRPVVQKPFSLETLAAGLNAALAQGSPA
jgi:CheY-like chemotaxis protein